MIIAPESLPVNGFDFARAIIEQKGDEAVEILLKCANGAETDWLEKKAAVYPSETADSEYRAKLQMLGNAPQATLQREKKLYCDKLLKEIACAIVALHNSRGGVVFIGITNDNEPVPFVDCNGIAQPNLTGSEAEDFIRKDIVSRLCPGDGYFECKGGTWRIPVQATSFFPKICRFRGLPVVALLVPALERGKPPIVTTLTQNNKPKDLALTRFPGDVGETRKRKDENQWVDTEAQRVKFLNDRDTAFLCREDLSTKLKELDLAVSRIPAIPSVEATIRHVFSSVSQPRTKNFVGRERELEELHGMLADGLIPVVTGPGGTGKSELVFQYAARNKASYPGGLFQVDMECVTDWNQAFLSMLGKPGVRDVLGLLENNDDGMEGETGDDSNASMSELPDGTGMSSGKFLRGDINRRKKTVPETLSARIGREGPILLILDNVDPPACKTLSRKPPSPNWNFRLV